MRPRLKTMLTFDGIGTAALQAALASGLLAASACSGGEAEDDETSVSAADAEQAESPAADEAPEPVGSLTIDGRSYELVRAFWCEPRSGGESGTEVVAQVGAFHEDNRFITVMATQVDRDRDRPSVQSVSASIPGTDSNHRSGDVVLDGDAEPALIVEDGQARIQAEVRSGGEVVPLEAEFTLPDEPGLDLHC